MSRQNKNDTVPNLRQNVCATYSTSKNVFNKMWCDIAGKKTSREIKNTINHITPSGVFLLPARPQRKKPPVSGFESGGVELSMMII